jgi:hypothetical protein
MGPFPHPHLLPLLLLLLLLLLCICAKEARGGLGACHDLWYRVYGL